VVAIAAAAAAAIVVSALPQPPEDMQTGTQAGSPLSLPAHLPTCPRLQSPPQLDGAFEYLKRIGGEPLDAAALEEAAGVGVVVTQEQVAAAVAGAVDGARERLLEERCACCTHHNTRGAAQIRLQ
jgi:Glutaminyl-tRNA synthetase, non-specific RNA binding region part 1